MVYRRRWLVILSGFFEPVFYLLGIGFGLGKVVGDVDGIPYAAFVAPALMATSAMNGAIYDSTFNLFYKLKYARTYDAMLSTPMGVPDVAIGEMTWALTRGAHLCHRLHGRDGCAGPGVVAAGAAGGAGIGAHRVRGGGPGHGGDHFVRTWQDFDLVFVITLPLFLFSATFFPITTYPRAAADVRGDHAALPGCPPAARPDHRHSWTR